MFLSALLLLFIVYITICSSLLSCITNTSWCSYPLSSRFFVSIILRLLFFSLLHHLYARILCRHVLMHHDHLDVLIHTSSPLHRLHHHMFVITLMHHQHFMMFLSSIFSILRLYHPSIRPHHLIVRITNTSILLISNFSYHPSIFCITLPYVCSSASRRSHVFLSPISSYPDNMSYLPSSFIHSLILLLSHHSPHQLSPYVILTSLDLVDSSFLWNEYYHLQIPDHNSRISWFRDIFYMIYCPILLIRWNVDYYTRYFSKLSIFIRIPPKVMGSSLQLANFTISIPTETL